MVITGGLSDDDSLGSELLQLAKTDDAMKCKSWPWPKDQDKSDVIGGVINYDTSLLCFPNSNNENKCFSAFNGHEVENMTMKNGDKRLMSAAGVNINANEQYILISGGISGIDQGLNEATQLKTSERISDPKQGPELPFATSGH